MPLILAIEPDRRQASRLGALARPLKVDLLVSESVERALEILSTQTPDVVLTPMLMLPKDEAALAERLRELDAAGTRVQTLAIPVLATGRRSAESGTGAGLLTRLRRSRPASTSHGCEPAVFAAQIAEYLERAAAERVAQAAKFEDDQPYDPHLLQRGTRNRKSPTTTQAVRAAVTEVEVPTAIDPAIAEWLEPATPEERVVDSGAEPIAEAIVEPIAEAVAEPIAEPMWDVQPEAPDAVALSPIEFEPAPIDVATSASRIDVPDTTEPSELVERGQPFADVAAADIAAADTASLDGAAVVNAAVIDTIVVAETVAEVETASVRSERKAPAAEALERIAREHAHLGTRRLAHLEQMLESDVTVKTATEPSVDLEAVIQLEQPTDAPAAIAQAADPHDSFEDVGSFVVDSDPERDLWMPLPVATRAAWPHLEPPIVRSAPAQAPSVAASVAPSPIARPVTPSSARPVQPSLNIARAVAAAASTTSSAATSAPASMAATDNLTPPVVPQPTAVATVATTIQSVAPKAPISRTTSRRTGGGSPGSNAFVQTKVEGFAGSRLSEAAAIEAALTANATGADTMPLDSPDAAGTGPDPLTEFSLTPRSTQKKRTQRTSKPVQDEWGFFDPLQCGFAALLDKLEEITKDDDRKPALPLPSKPSQKPRVR